MLSGVYREGGVCVRNYCGAEPPRDIEPPGLVTTAILGSWIHGDRQRNEERNGTLGGQHLKSDRWITLTVETMCFCHSVWKNDSRR